MCLVLFIINSSEYIVKCIEPGKGVINTIYVENENNLIELQVASGEHCFRGKSVAKTVFVTTLLKTNVEHKKKILQN